MLLYFSVNDSKMFSSKSSFVKVVYECRSDVVALTWYLFW